MYLRNRAPYARGYGSARGKRSASLFAAPNVDVRRGKQQRMP